MSEPISVSGIKELNKALRGVESGLPKKMRVALNAGAAVVAQEARSRAPSRTGRARGSYRTLSTQRAARVGIGGAKARYVPWLEFGGRTGVNRSARRQFIKSGRYLFPALDRKRVVVIQILEQGITEIIEQAGLDVT